ncbi:MAG: 50S ribosomal protein L18a [Candidatus Bathyarchaeota archaeon]|nr:MAG: 50S ribosomal protein L18a [Candidatus Bathyarchaeota archaeon]
MSEAKIFRITGRIDKPGLFEPITFSKEIAAAKDSHALEKIYAEMGSRHRAKRHQIKILGVEEVESPEGA